MGRVEDKVAFITGAARGQGRSHALRLAEEGADIIALDICDQIESVQYSMATMDDLHQTQRMVEQRKRRIIAQRGDVRRSDDLERAVQKGLAAFGHIDIVCANAGIGSTALAWELTERQWRDMIDVNLTGAWLTARAVIPQMIVANRGGSIIFISSIAGLVGRMNMAHYAAAKHGLVGLMRTLANELAPYRIRVNSVHPTNVDTDMIRSKAGWSLYLPDDREPTKEKFAESITTLNAIPIPWVESVDVSNAILWLASDEARFVTGVALPVDAGAAIKSP